MLLHILADKEGEFDINQSVMPIKKWFEKRLNLDIELLNNFENIPENVVLWRILGFQRGER